MRLEISSNDSADSAVSFVEDEHTRDTVSENDSAEVSEMLRAGIRAAQTGNRAEARILLLRVTEADSKNENAWLWLASISEYPEELLVFLNNVLDINPENERALEWAKATKSLLAKTFIQRGIDAHKESRKDFARQCFLQAIVHDNRNEMAWLWLASVAESGEEKVAHLNRVLEINPENENALASLKSAKSHMAQGLLQKAKTAVLTGESESAEYLLKEILEISPELDEAWVLKSHITNSFAEKVQCFERILEFNPDSEVAKANLDSLRSMMKTETKTEDFKPDNWENLEGVNDDGENAVENVENQTFEEQYLVEDSFDEEVFSADVPTQELYFSAEEEPYSEVVSNEPETYSFLGNVEESNGNNLDEWSFTEQEAPFEDGFEDRAMDPSSMENEEFSFEEISKALIDEEMETEYQAPQVEMVGAQANAFEVRESFEEETGAESDSEVICSAEEGSWVSEEENAEECYEIDADEVFAAGEVSENDSSQESPGVGDDFVEESVEDSAEEHFSAEAERNVEQAEKNHQTIAEMVECPFCREENESQAFMCVGCRAMLTLSDLEMLLAHHEADAQILQKAVGELEVEDLSRGLEPDELVNLGIGHINLKNLRKGMSFLQKAVKLNPNNVVLDSQVNSLAIRLAEIEEKESSQNPVPKDKTIMVVDDSPTVRKLISGKLEKCGHTVIMAIDGMDAMEKLNQVMPDLILLDITMPRMDGYQVCKLIRGNEATKEIPIVMISGKDGFFDKVRGRMAGTTSYITKPFGPETLMKMLETYLY